jgi:hypothetical protein
MVSSPATGATGTPPRQRDPLQEGRASGAAARVTSGSANSETVRILERGGAEVRCEREHVEQQLAKDLQARELHAFALG